MSERAGRDGQGRSENGREHSARSLLALGACILGLILAVVGFLAVFVSGTATASSISPGAIGAVLGILGYVLGARRLGTITIALCVVALFFGLAASQGLIPGLEGYDRGLPGSGPGPR